MTLVLSMLALIAEICNRLEFFAGFLAFLLFASLFLGHQHYPKLFCFLRLLKVVKYGSMNEQSVKIVITTKERDCGSGRGD